MEEGLDKQVTEFLKEDLMERLLVYQRVGVGKVDGSEDRLCWKAPLKSWFVVFLRRQFRFYYLSLSRVLSLLNGISKDRFLALPPMD